MNVCTRLIRGATLAGVGISSVLLIITTLLLVANVALRYIGIQILGLYEILGAVTVGLLGLSLGDSQRRKQHVAIDILTVRLPATIQRIIGVFTLSVSFLIFAFILVALIRYSTFQTAAATASEILQIPTWPALTALIAGMALLLFALAEDIRRETNSLVTGQAVEEVW